MVISLLPRATKSNPNGKFISVPGLEFRASHFLDRSSATLNHEPSPFFFGYFFQIGFHILPRHSLKLLCFLPIDSCTPWVTPMFPMSSYITYSLRLGLTYYLPELFSNYDPLCLHLKKVAESIGMGSPAVLEWYFWCAERR